MATDAAHGGTEQPRLLTAIEASAYLRVHRDVLYRLVHRGVVPARRIGGRLRFDESELATLGRLKASTLSVERPSEARSRHAVSVRPPGQPSPVKPEANVGRSYGGTVPG